MKNKRGDIRIVKIGLKVFGTAQDQVSVVSSETIEEMHYFFSHFGRNGIY